MIRLDRKRRKSRALTGGLPQCLHHTGTVAFNVISGCTLECHYCKYRARSQVPPDSATLYTELPQQLAEELGQLKSRGHLPRMVLFNTTSEPFIGNGQIDKLAGECLEVLCANGLFVNLSTKGIIPRTLYETLSRHAQQVAVTLSIASREESFIRLYEPRVARPEDRLRRLRELTEIGVPVRGRIEPLLPMENDGDEALAGLLADFRRAGVREVVIAYLQLDHHVQRRLKERLGRVSLNMLLPWFKDANGHVQMLLDAAYRRKKYEAAKKLGRKVGIRVLVCACRNADLYTGRCFLLPDPLDEGGRQQLL